MFQITKVRVILVSILCAAVGVSVLSAADMSSYRGLKFGMDIAAASKQAGAKYAEVRVIHDRPALMQEIDSQPGPGLADLSKADPLKDVTLAFFNGQLYRIVASYDRYKVEGMSADDMVEAISATYGPGTKDAGQIPYHSNYGETATVISRWENTEYSYNLIQTGDRSSFALVLFSKRMQAQAEAANVEAARLDSQEAPQREIAKQKNEANELRLALDKARAVNKPNFHP